MTNQKRELAETEKSSAKKSTNGTIGKTVTTVTLTLVTLFIALIIGLPLYLYIPLGAFVFFCLALGFYLFSFRLANKRLQAEIESLRAASENYQHPPPPPKF